jgi:hypothetical protein
MEGKVVQDLKDTFMKDLDQTWADSTAYSKIEGGAISWDPGQVHITTTTSGSGLITGSLSGGYPAQPKYHNAFIRMTLASLEGPAGSATLEELAEIWSARFGSGWARHSELEGEFYHIATQRLLYAGQLEEHQLDTGENVYKLVP